MTVRQWSDHVFAAYIGVTDRPFSGVFVGTATTWLAARFLALQAMCEDRQAGGVVESVTGQPARRERSQRSTGELDPDATDRSPL